MKNNNTTKENNPMSALLVHFEKQRDSLVKIATRRIGEFWAEDAVQDAYERVLRYDSFQAGANMDVYLKRILEHVMIKYERDSLGHEEVEEWMQESGELSDEFRDAGVVEEALAHLRELDEPHRSAVYMSVFQGDKLSSISRITGLTEPAIWNATNRYRKEMREKLL